ncbi:hypothetical protein V1505DRAFT_148729 [Lipomyces doorenjongii]
MVSYYDVPRPQAFPDSMAPKTLSLTEVRAIAETWAYKFEAAVTSSDAAAFEDLFAPEGYWRDMVAFTSDFRSIAKPNIRQVAADRLSVAKANSVALTTPIPIIDSPFEDVSYVQAHFTFKTSIGGAVGIVKLIPSTTASDYVAYLLFTTLDSVEGVTERVGANRVRGKHNACESYDESRQAEIDNPEPEVIIVGGGHNGLEIAARLKMMGVNSLVIDKYKRVGDNWRLRYKSLSLHDPVYSNHLAYMPFPTTWPIWTPSGKLSNFIEYYADAMELNVWTESSVVTSETYFDSDHTQWFVTIDRNGKKYTYTVSHLVLATGIGGGHPKLPPPFLGQNIFTKQIVHSANHKNGGSWQGKNALVVGACTSAHDIALDFFKNGANTTMLQRSPTYVMSVKHGVSTVNPYKEGDDTWTVDLLAEATPKLVGRLWHKRFVPRIKELDRELLDGLTNAGFQLYDGMEGCGFFLNTNERSGGYYYDTGCSPHIANGDIQIKKGEIDHFTVDSVVLKDGSVLKPDIVVFATGYTGFRDTVKEILGEEYSQNMKEFWGLDREGELRGTCRDCGVPNTYYVVGPLSGARFNSKITALQIVAEKKGLLGPRYSIEVQESGKYSKFAA